MNNVFDEIVDNWRIIKKEAMKVLKNAPLNDIDRKYEMLANPRIQIKGWVRGWTNDVNWVNFGLIFHQHTILWNSKQCRKTYRLISKLAKDYKIVLAGFSLLKPGGKIPKHNDKNLDGDITLHLPLYVPEPEKCVLGVKDNTYHHYPGKLIQFNDADEHYAYNNSSYNRIILYVKLDKK